MSDEPKWTPGPWVASRMNMPRTWDYWEIGSIQPDIPVAEIDNTGLGEATEEANARLIAAAPELYEALVELGDALNGMIATRGTALYAANQKALAACAKARGTSLA